MRVEGKLIHLGINFIFAPQPIIDRSKSVEFQRALLEQGLDVARSQFVGQKIEVTCQDAAGLLTLTVGLVGPQVGQLLLVAGHPRSWEIFKKYVDAGCRAFEMTWAGPRQIISRDATVQELHETTTAHAFQELWEQRLGQSRESLQYFGRPVLGGGLRFVMPPRADEPEPVTMEVKIESFLQDGRKFYIETQLSWPQPTLPSIGLDPDVRLRQLQEYMQKNVIPFIMENRNGPSTR